MLTAAMDLAASGMSGLALGAWGAVQATAAGLAIARERHRCATPFRRFPNTAHSARPSPDRMPDTVAVYQIEIVLLFATLAAIGPLVRSGRRSSLRAGQGFGLAEYARLIEENLT